MALIEWREECCTGIKGVDYEHEQLVRQINAVHALITDQADRSLVIDGLGEIYGSISAHFALEEQMMQRHHYDHYLEHKADHESACWMIFATLPKSSRVRPGRMKSNSNRSCRTGSSCISKPTIPDYTISPE